MHQLPNSLTESKMASGVVVVAMTEAQRTDTSVRSVPYAERYAGYSGIFQTPVERLQAAATEDQ